MTSPEDSNHAPDTTAGSRLTFADGTSKIWRLNPRLGLTTETAPWVNTLVGLVMQGDIVSTEPVDSPVIQE